MSEPPYLSATRVAYDTVAVDYAKQLEGDLAARPVDRAMLSAFAEFVQGDGGGPVADLGCGPGRITAFLHTLGVTGAFGVDLSPGMIAVAQRAYPDLRFEVGSMTDLKIGDGRLGGVVAWYSIIHSPPEVLPVAFGEFHRVLRPGGSLLLAFQVGDERVHVTEACGHSVAVDAYRLPPDRISGLLTEAGFDTSARLVREPVAPEKTPQAFLLARRITRS